MNVSARPKVVRAIIFVLLILFGTTLLVSACVSQTKTATPAVGQEPPPSPPSASPSSPGATSGGAPSAGRTPTRTVPAPVTVPRLPGRSLPLWPFADGQQVRTWEASYRSGGAQPWHLSADQTALAFTQGYLGYTEVNRVVRSSVSGGQARVAVGYRIPEGTRLATAAVIHLVRFGSGRYAPWEVVGTDDTTLSLKTPAYGARVSTRMTAGGRITGVDENIRVQVRQLSSASPVGVASVPAGGQNQPWSTTVTTHGATDRVLTIAAATGGHLAAVERFAITGVVR